ncbi:hypothetical protein BHS07_34890 [Myxococcus xanthus]|nr:hypothetical protein BHS07_34890 [Myxococcus xanthus]
MTQDGRLSRTFLEWGSGGDGRALSFREGGRVIVSRLIWSRGFAGLALACAVAAWLHRPVELPSQAAEPEASTPLAQAPTPRPRSVARVTFPDSDSFQESFRRTADLRLGEGTTHMQLPPERRASGEVVAAWLVLRPATP